MYCVTTLLRITTILRIGSESSMSASFDAGDVADRIRPKRKPIVSDDIRL